MSHIGHKTTFSSPPSRALADDFMSGRLPDSAGTGAGYSSTGAFAIKASGEAGAAGASGLCGDHRQQVCFATRSAAMGSHICHGFPHLPPLVAPALLPSPVRDRSQPSRCERRGPAGGR